MINPSTTENQEAELRLIAEVLAGNLERYYDLIAPIQRRVYLTAYEVLGNPADAEDVAQEAILKGFRSLKTFRGESRFSTWILRITMNEARMRLRKNKEVSLQTLIPGDGEDDSVPMQLADWREIPGEALEEEEMTRHLTAAIEALPLPYREVLVLRDIDGLSIAETSSLLDLTISNVKIRLLRARLMLRDYFVSNRLMSANMAVEKRRK